MQAPIGTVPGPWRREEFYRRAPDAPVESWEVAGLLGFEFSARGGIMVPDAISPRARPRPLPQRRQPQRHRAPERPHGSDPARHRVAVRDGPDRRLAHRRLPAAALPEPGRLLRLRELQRQRRHRLGLRRQHEQPRATGVAAGRLRPLLRRGGQRRPPRIPLPAGQHLQPAAALGRARRGLRPGHGELHPQQRAAAAAAAAAPPASRATTSTTTAS